MIAARSLAAIALLAAVAQAQPASEADRLFEEGRAFADTGDHAAACERFAQSYELDPAVGTKLNLGDCHEHLGKLREALRWFEAAATELEQSGETKRAQFARSRARAIVARFVVVTVKPAEPERAGLSITIAGRTVVPAPAIRELVEPGTIPIVASVPDRPPFSTSVTASAGASVTIDVPAFTVDTPAPATTRRSRNRVLLAGGLAAGGGASGVVAGLLTLRARGNYQDVADGSSCMRVPGGITCDASGAAEIRDAQRLADIGTGFAIAAVALVGAAVAVYATAPQERVTIAPIANAETVGIAASVEF